MNGIARQATRGIPRSTTPSLNPPSVKMSLDRLTIKSNKLQGLSTGPVTACHTPATATRRTL